jgi:hypothetical protein
MTTGWALPNRRRFIEDTVARFTYDTSVYKADQTGCDASGGPTGNVSLFEHQRIVARFLSEETPYRGLLLYHGLGAGKSCAAINAAAQHAGRRRTVVLLPAALEANFVGEVAKCGRAGPSTRWRFEPLKGTAALSAAAARTGINVAVLRRNGGLWMDAEDGTALSRLPPEARAQVHAQVAAEITFFHYNGLTRSHLGALTRLLDTEQCIVIIDEVHNFISRAINNPTSLAAMLHTLLCSSSTVRVIALSGTPFLNHPREIAFLVNLVKGFERMVDVSIRVQAAAASGDVALAMTRDLGACAYVDHVERLDFQRGRLRLRMAPPGFRRVEGELFAADPDSTPEAGVAEVKGVLSRLGVGIIGEPHEVTVPLMPQDVEGFFEAFVDEGTLSLKNKDMFRRRMLGFVSHFGFQNRELFPAIRSDEVVRCDMHPHQAKRYMEVRSDEIKTEEAVAKRRAALNMLDNPGQVYKTFSRMACNFVFPTGIKRPYPSTMEELTVEEGGGGDATYEGAIARAVAAIAKDGDTHLGRNLAHHSAKFQALLDRLDTSPGTALLYSQFRTVEGITLLAEALRVRGYTELRARGVASLDIEGDASHPRFIVYDGSSQLLLDVFNSNMAAVPPAALEQLHRVHGPDASNVRGDIARVLLITQSGAEGISLRNVRQVHILEPYWNNIRLDQVIGRAVRTCSHTALPRGDRDVRVYRYVSVLPRALVPPTSRVMLHDGGRTADELVMGIAERKTHVMREILDMMREVAVDCAAHRELHEGVTCYTFSGQQRDGLAYDVDLALDELAGQAEKQTAQLVEIQHKQYLLMAATNDLYDYKLYKRGILRYVGRLVPITRDGRKGFYIKEP